MTPPRILHISLSHGGGVISAMETYIINSQFAEHFLVAKTDKSCSIEFSDEAKLNEINYIDLNFSGILAIYKTYKRTKPTHIHLHSSHAGALGRILFPFFKKIIYTPHCYSFERLDVSAQTKKLFFCLEWFLSLIPTVVAGCSPREVELSNRLGISSFSHTSRSVFLTNYSTSLYQWMPQARSNKTVVMVGRICPQKDAKFYIDTYHAVKKISPEIKFLWLGNGDSADVAKLVESGVECSGWLSKHELMQKLCESSLYFHCAAWEGNPMSVLEVASIKMPIVGRRIKSLESIGLSELGTSPDECAAMIYNYFQDSESNAIAQYIEVNKLCSLTSQKIALKAIYTE